MQNRTERQPGPWLLSGLLASNLASGGQLDIHISGMTTNDGAARIVLMKGREAYSGQRPVALTGSVRIRDGRARWQVDVPNGTYAVIAHHDKDANGTLNRPLFELPIEPYGYSNGAWTSIGLPAFDDVAFDVDDDTTRQQIHLRTNAFVTLAQLVVVAAGALAVLFGALALSRRFHLPISRST